MESIPSQPLQVDVQNDGTEAIDPALRKNSPFTPPPSANSTSPVVSGWESSQAEINPRKRRKVEATDAKNLQLQKLVQTYDIATTKIEPAREEPQPLANSDSPLTIESLQRQIADLSAELSQTQQKLREKEAESATQAEYLSEYLKSIGVRDEQLKDASIKSRELQDTVFGLKARLGPSFSPRPIPDVRNLLFSCRVGNLALTSGEHALKILESHDALERLQKALEATKKGIESECSAQWKHDAELCIRDLEAEIETKFEFGVVTGRWEYKASTLEAQLLDIIKRRKKSELEEAERLVNDAHRPDKVS